MSVTLVPPPSTPAQPAATDSATSSDATASSGDFADLLQDQLAAATAGAATQLLAADPPATKSSSSDKDNSTTTDQGTDATSLLATLALVTPSVSNTGTTSTASSEQSSNSALGALAAASPFEKAAQAKDAADTLKSARQTTETTPADDATAKFAVTPVATDELADTQKSSKDTESIDVTAMNHAIHTHAGKQQETSATSVSVATPVRDQDWANDFSQQVVWLASADKQSAQLTLNPEQMGPIEISVSMDKGNASVSFTSANAEVRDAIETALPKLREMFASAGIELGQTNVGSGAFQQQTGNGQSQSQSGSSRLTADNAILGADTLTPLQSRTFSAQRGNGLVDLFA